MRGNTKGRHILGMVEANAGNMDRSIKHFMISAGSGDDCSLEEIRNWFLKGHVRKDDFEKGTA